LTREYLTMSQFHLNILSNENQFKRQIVFLSIILYKESIDLQGEEEEEYVCVCAMLGTY